MRKEELEKELENAIQMKVSVIALGKIASASHDLFEACAKQTGLEHKLEEYTLMSSDLIATMTTNTFLQIELERIINALKGELKRYEEK